MLVLQLRAPTGVVDRQVEEELGSAQVHCRSELAELLDRGGGAIELHQRGVDGGEVGGGVGAAEAAHARVGGGGGVDRQQVEDAAAEGVDHMRHLLHQVAQGAGRRDDGVAVAIEGEELLLKQRLTGTGQDAGRAEGAGEGAVDQVGGALAVGMHRDADIVAIRPVLAPVAVNHVGLGTVVADRGQRQLDRPAVAVIIQAEVVPGGAGEGLACAERGDRLVARFGGAPEVGAQHRAPARAQAGPGGVQGEAHAIADEAQQAFAGRGRHGRRRHGL